MASFAYSHAETSSVALIELQTNLKSLSERMSEMARLLGCHVNELGEEWRDEKFFEFEENFKEERMELQAIADRYMEWATGYLQRKIEETIEYEKGRTGIK